MAHVLLSYAQRASYRIYDLPEPVALQRRYLDALGWRAPQANATALRLGRHASREPEPECDLVLSNVALSELDARTQLLYAERLLVGARVGIALSYNWMRADAMRPWLRLLARRGFDVRYARHPVNNGSCSEVLARPRRKWRPTNPPPWPPECTE